jgi:excisionase family DNA binding protein
MPAVPTGELPLLLSVRDVAALLGCSPRHIYRLAESGRFPKPIKLGTLTRWPRSAVKKFIAGQKGVNRG